MTPAESLFSGLTRSELMSRIRSSRNKGTELKLITIFRAQGISGWRRGSVLPGKPDFVFPSLKLALFVDGCFWHGCPKHGLQTRKRRSAVSRSSFWVAKITSNRARDRRVSRDLRQRGWRVIRIWEHELAKKDRSRLLSRLSSLLPTKSHIDDLRRHRRFRWIPETKHTSSR